MFNQAFKKRKKEREKIQFYFRQGLPLSLSLSLSLSSLLIFGEFKFFLIELSVGSQEFLLIRLKVN